MHNCNKNPIADHPCSDKSKIKIIPATFSVKRIWFKTVVNWFKFTIKVSLTFLIIKINRDIFNNFYCVPLFVYISWLHFLFLLGVIYMWEIKQKHQQLHKQVFYKLLVICVEELQEHDGLRIKFYVVYLYVWVLCRVAGFLLFWFNGFQYEFNF